MTVMSTCSMLLAPTSQQLPASPAGAFEMAGQKLLQISLLTELREPLNPEGDALYLEADSLASSAHGCV